MPTCRSFIVVVVAFAVGGCSAVKFYDDPDMQTNHEVPVKTYFGKPYLLVAGGGDKSTSATVVTLPDLQHPVYVKLRPGYGSSNLSIGLNGAILASVGQQSDNRLPESVTALGGLDSAMAAATKDRADAARSATQLSYSGQIAGAADNIRAALKADTQHVVSESDRQTLQQLADALATSQDGKPGGLAETLNAQRTDQTPDQVANALSRIAGKMPSVARGRAGDKNGISGRLLGVQDQIGRIADQLKNTPAATPSVQAPIDFTLYDISMEGGVTTLQPVKMKKLSTP